MVKKLETIIGSVGKKLASSIKELEETIGKKIVEFAARLKSFVENVHEFALSLIRRMFGFVEDIQKIAKENNWNMKQIVIEMPSCDVKVLLIAGFPIPIPKISVPKLAVTFAPL
jgi:predicted nucleotidyltransferase